MMAVIGGTFDPVHYGHLQSAIAVREIAGVDRVKLIPCQVPPHRCKPIATAADRVAMLRLAINHEAGLEIDRRELTRHGPSYTYDTLYSLRQELNGTTPLIFVMGQDAFLTLPGWHRWRELCDLAHLLVLARPGVVDAEPGALSSWAEGRHRADLSALTSRPAGYLVKLQLVQVPVSATNIREAYRHGSLPTGVLPKIVSEAVPPAVHRYITERGLYRAAATDDHLNSQRQHG